MRVLLYYLNCSFQKPSSDLEQNVSKSKEKKKKPKKTAAAAIELNGKVELEGKSKLKHVEPLTFKVLSCDKPPRPLSNNEASWSFNCTIECTSTWDVPIHVAKSYM